MEAEGQIVIITDNAGSTQQIAGAMVTAIESSSFSSYQTAITPAESFSGVELLPACIFFLGCETPNPIDFNYISDLFKHINLAGRPCGIFSQSRKALKYLATLVRDSEAALGEPFFAQRGVVNSDKLEKWIHGILTGDTV